MYTLFRSKNGGERERIATVRSGGEQVYLDRDVAPGDQLTYVVVAFGSSDQRTGTSEAVVVALPRS